MRLSGCVVLLGLVWTVAAAGFYVGVFCIGFGWLYNDIDGPVSIGFRMFWTVVGVAVLILVALATRLGTRVVRHKLAPTSA